jgi:hypothetical protein
MIKKVKSSKELDDTIDGFGIRKKTNVSDERVKHNVKFFSTAGLGNNPFEAYGKKLGPLVQISPSKVKPRKGIMATQLSQNEIRKRNRQRRKSLTGN